MHHASRDRGSSGATHRWCTCACRRTHISIRELTHCAFREVSRENFYLAYLLKIFSTKQIAQTPWRVKSFIAIDRSYSTGESFHINWRSFDANMLTEGVTNMPTWVVITTICKFGDTSPLSLWKRLPRLHHTFWKLYVIFLSRLSSTIGIANPTLRS